LVQNGFYLTDGSMIRLTVARYYTPTGRSIQRPYNEGYDKYMYNFKKRYEDGELITADSSPHLPDSLKFKTMVNHRIVYGGGGIMPDVFVGADTSNYSDYYKNLVRKNVFNTFTLEYFDKNRIKLNSEYKSFDDFKKRFAFSPEDIKTFIKMGEDAGAKYNDNQFMISQNVILKILKGFIATNIWKTNEYLRIVNEGDVVIEKALKVINDKNAYNKILGY
jgi:carboxyl-terminal processing protease